MDAMNEANAAGDEEIQDFSTELIPDNPVRLRIKRRRTQVADVYLNVETRLSVTGRAEQLLSSLKSEVPYFVKCMLPSNVSYSFWMILPAGFCKAYLPHYDSTITLVDEQGNESNATYLFVRRGLSAGWRRFAISHRLQMGDRLIFQLIEHCKFKVHIVRVYDLEVIDAAQSLMELGASSGITDSDSKKNRARKAILRRKLKTVKLSLDSMNAALWMSMKNM